MIVTSLNETERLGLKVGHLTTEALDPAALSAALIEGRFDLCRLKIRVDHAPDSGVAALESAGFPYYHAGGILRYRVDYRRTRYRPRAPEDVGLEFLHVDESNRPRLAALVRESFGDDPIGYYKTPWLAAIVSKDAELDCLIDYYLDGRVTEKLELIVRKDGRDAGFIVLSIDGGTVHTPLLGILPEMRGLALFHPMRDYIHSYASERGMREEEGARIDNLMSQNLFGQDGLEHVANETIFHVLPLLSRSVGYPVKTEAAASELESRATQHAKQTLKLDGFYRASHRFVPIAPTDPNRRYPVTLRTPILSETLAVITATAEDPSGRPNAITYTEFRRS